MQYYGASVSADITCDNFNQAHLRMRKAGPATHYSTKTAAAAPAQDAYRPRQLTSFTQFHL